MKLETERLILRKPRMSDAQDIVEGVNNLNVSKNLAVVKYPYYIKDAKSWVSHCLKSWSKKNKKDYYFFIELKSEKKLIGAIDLSINSTGIGRTGSWVNENYHRKGYMTEAKIAINEFAFNKLKIRKLETEAYSDNIASNATQKSVGYKYEGCRIKHSISLSTGKIHDENLYGLLRKDWKKNLPKLKKHLKEKIKKLEKKK